MKALPFVQHLVSLVQKEMKIDKKETEKLLSGPPLALQSKGVANLNLKVTDAKPGFGSTVNLVLEVITKSRKPVNIPQHKLKVGDIVGFKEYALYYEKDSSPWTGIIVGISKWKILLCLNETDDKISISSLPSMIEACQIVKLPNDVSHERMLGSLTRLMDIIKKKQLTTLNKVLLGLQPLSKPMDMSKIEIKDTSLNEYQKKAVLFALGSPEISLIHGPPGTGKTHTLIEIIRQLVQDKKKVLVCGPSHVSVDNLVERYVKYDSKVVRIGHPARVSPNAVRWTLDVLCSGGDPEKISEAVQNELKKLSAKLRSSGKASEEKSKNEILKKINSLLKGKVTRAKIAEKLKKANVVFSTLNGSGSTNLKFKNFDVVIIDEAGQSTEPDCWIALSKAKKAILSGDHLQLPPTVKTPPKPVCKLFKGMSPLSDLSYTLFDRVIGMHGKKIKTLLSIQYRMNEKIMTFSSTKLYENKLIADVTVENHLLKHLPNVRKTDETSIPIVMADTGDTKIYHESKGGKMDKQSTANEYEVRVVVHYINKLLKDGLKQKEIAVITPYKAQVTKLLLAMGEKWLDIEVGTVDGFQGREKEAIILSMVRSNARGEVGFLAEKRRLNVAMTRARRHLVVVGDTETLSGFKNCSKEKKSIYFIDRTFLDTWIEWLKKESEVRHSKAILDL